MLEVVQIYIKGKSCRKTKFRMQTKLKMFIFLNLRKDLYVVKCQNKFE